MGGPDGPPWRLASPRARTASGSGGACPPRHPEAFAAAFRRKEGGGGRFKGHPPRRGTRRGVLALAAVLVTAW